MFFRRKTHIVNDLVKVIRDPRDSSKDYMIPRSRAEKLYTQGKLSQIQCENGWQYLADNNKRFK